MARAVAGDERIGLLVESKADVSGFRAARQENSALAREARAAAGVLAGSAQEGTTAQQSLANAAKAAADAQTKVTISAEQSRQMWARAGGDYSRFLELVRAHVAEQKSLAAATAQATAAQQQQNQAVGGGRSVGAGGASDPRRVLDDVAAKVDRIPAKARTAANALSMMAFSAVEGSGGLRSLTVAAGTAADGIATLSGNARIAASAAGIGALATVLVAAIALMDRAKEKARAAGAAIAGSLGDMTDEALEARSQMAQAAFERQAEKLAGLRAKGGGIFGIDINIPEIVKAENELERLAAQRETIFNEQLDRRRNRGREAARDAAEQEKQDVARSKEMLTELAIAHQDHYNARTQSLEGALRLKAEREFNDRVAEINALRIHEDEKTTLVAAAARLRGEQLTAIHLEAAARQNEIERRLFEQQQERAERSLEMVQDQARAALHTAITGGESFIQAATRALLAPLVRRLEAVAVEQGIEALVEAAFGNFIGAARHAAVASAAILAAQKVAGWAGMTSGGGGSSVAAGPTLSAGDPSKAPTNVTVVVQTVNPFSKEVMGETQYQLNRSGVLKQPIYAPPTSGAYAA